MAAPEERSFDDRDGWIWFDGELVPWRDAKVHVLTHALHYASSVFEGQRGYGGVVFKLREHSERLKQSARLLGFELPWTVEEIDAACNEVVKANGWTDCYMRPVAWRGSESMGVAPGKTKPHLAIAGWEWGKYYGDKLAQEGIRMDIAPWRRPAPALIAPLKDSRKILPRQHRSDEADVGEPISHVGFGPKLPSVETDAPLIDPVRQRQARQSASRWPQEDRRHPRTTTRTGRSMPVSRVKAVVAPD